MKRLLAVLALFVFTAQAVNAQSGTPTPTPTPEVAQERLPKSPELTEAERLNARVVHLYGEKKYEEALPLAERALAIREEKLGGEHMLVAISLTNLAGIYVSKEKYGAAQKLYERALGIYGKNPAPYLQKIRAVNDTLSLLYRKDREFDKLEKLLVNDLALKEKHFGLEHDEVIKSLFLLGKFYEVREDYGKAEPVVRRILSLTEKQQGREDFDTVAAMRRLACLLNKMDKTKEAKSLEVEATEIYDREFAKIKDSIKPATSAGVLNGRAVSKPQPAYPAIALRDRAQGTISVFIVVDEVGEVISACSMQGHPELRRASEQAAFAARFTPTLLRGKPVRVTGVITYNFVLR